MATRKDQSHIVVEKSDTPGQRNTPGYRCTQCSWENHTSDSQGRDDARRHERNTFGMGDDR